MPEIIKTHFRDRVDARARARVGGRIASRFISSLFAVSHHCSNVVAESAPHGVTLAQNVLGFIRAVHICSIFRRRSGFTPIWELHNSCDRVCVNATYRISNTSSMCAGVKLDGKMSNRPHCCERERARAHAHYRYVIAIYVPNECLVTINPNCPPTNHTRLARTRCALRSGLTDI